MVLKNLDIRDVFPQKHGTSHVYPNWQGTAIVFPALITILLGNAYVLKRVFCVSSRLKSVVVFLAQAHPNRCFFARNSSQFEIKSGKNGTSQNHMTIAKKNYKI
jgi:hypothetical protein